jgi:citrate synthase
MKPFWRKDPLTDDEQALLTAVLDAHDASARRNNISSQAVAINAQAAGDYGKAIAGAILTLGGIHGPIEQAQYLLSRTNPALAADTLLANGRKVPGWGNSFHRGEADPLWIGVDQLLRPTRLARVLDSVTETIRARGKDLFPNPAGYTAAVCIVLGVPAQISCMLFLAGRLSAWSEIYLRNA